MREKIAEIQIDVYDTGDGLSFVYQTGGRPPLSNPRWTLKDVILVALEKTTRYVKRSKDGLTRAD